MSFDKDREGTAARRGWARALAGLAVALGGGTAAAGDAQPAALGWVRAPGAEACIGTAALARAVEARLGRAALVSAARAQVSVEGRIAPAEGGTGWRVALSVADENGKVLGTRTLAKDATDCRAMDEDVILTVALLIDPEAALSAPPAATTTPPPKTPPPVSTSGSTAPLPASTSGSTAPLPASTSAPTAPLPKIAPPKDKEPPAARAPSGPWSVALLGGAVASVGPLPNVGVGAQLRALITPVPFFSFQLGGSVWLPQTTSLGDNGGRFFMALGTLSGCPLTGVRAGIRYAACAGVEFGAMHAGGFGFPLTVGRDDPLVNGLLEARVVRKIVGPFAASVGAGLSVPFLREQYYYVDPGGTPREVFLASPVTGTLDLLLGVDL